MTTLTGGDGDDVLLGDLGNDPSCAAAQASRLNPAAPAATIR